MHLTEQHILTDDRFKDWCVKAKNLYNQSLYYLRQSLFGNIEYFSEYELIALFREFKEENYIQLPSHCGQEIIKNLFKDVKSWQKARKEYNKNPSKFSGRPKLPKYKNELSVLYFNNCQVKLKKGFMHFPKMIGIAPIKSDVPNIKYCRVIPKSNHFVVEFVYELADVKHKEYNNKALGIDLGLNNLATCVSTTGKSFIINGKPLKSINAFYNKRKSKLQSQSKNKFFTSKRIERLTFRRNNKIKNYIHHASKYIVEASKELDVTKIVIGNNKNWKQNINIGKRNNQNFASIPHSNLIKTIEYKAKLAGIEVVTTEESYTSKCSSFDLESIQKHETYVGKRIKRGLFRTSKGIKINADANGAANILRKVIGESFMDDSILSALIAPVRKRTFKQGVA